MSLDFASLAGPTLAFEPVDRTVSAAPAIVRSPTGRLIWLAELAGFRPGVAQTEAELASLATPELALRTTFEPVEELQHFRLSDLGYTSRSSDSVGERFYAPLLDAALPVSLDRELLLDPRQANFVSLAWGDLELVNARGIDGVATWDGLLEALEVDGLDLRILLGEQSLDTGRQIWLDPSFDDLSLMFVGTAEGWRPTETGVRVSMRDRSVELEVPVQSNLFGGGGGLDGDAALEGIPRPKTRGTVYNIPAFLIDEQNLIYQYSDAEGEVLNFYEAGLDASGGGIAFHSDVSDLWSGSTPAGTYRTDDSRALFQLGLKPVATPTLDARGYFPNAGYQETCADIARFLLSEDLGLEGLDLGPFVELAAEFPYQAGIYIGPQETQALEVLGLVMRSAGAQLGLGRQGRFRPYRLRRPNTIGLGAQVLALDATEILEVIPLNMPAGLSPAVETWRVGYLRNHTVQNSGLNDEVPAARQQFVAKALSFATGFSAAAARHPGRKPTAELETILQTKAGAEALAAHLAPIFDGSYRPYDLVLSLQSTGLDLGDPVDITYPMARLRHGRRGVVLGEAIRAGQPTRLRVFA